MPITAGTGSVPESPLAAPLAVPVRQEALPDRA